VALATPSFSEALIERRPDGSLPPQTPELLSKMVPPMFEALQRTLAPLLVEEQGRLQEPAFVQVGGWSMLIVPDSDIVVMSRRLLYEMQQRLLVVDMGGV
jgi:hypothetical protein